MPTWILDLNNISGGSDGEQLAGCCIIQNGQTYQFTEPNSNPLSTVGPPLPAGVFPFPPFNYQSIEGWSIISNPLVPGQNALGTWIVPATAVLPEQTGTYTAIYVDDSAKS